MIGLSTFPICNCITELLALAIRKLLSIKKIIVDNEHITSLYANDLVPTFVKPYKFAYSHMGYN